MRKYRRLAFALIVTGLCIGFVGTTITSIVYMAKDYNAYNTVYTFFNVSKALRMELTRLPIGKFWILRLLNLSHVAYVLFSVFFALRFSDLLSRGKIRFLHGTSLALALLQAVFLDPGVIIWLYMYQNGIFFSVLTFRAFYRVLTTVLRITSIAEIAGAGGLLVIEVFRAPRSERASTGLVALLFNGLTFVYIDLFSWLPAQALWLSRVAKYVGYESLPVYKPTHLNTYAPLASVFLIVCFCLVTWYKLWKNVRDRRYDEAFRSKVDAVDTVSRVFCHYLKNELLSQQAELKLLSLKIDPPAQADIAGIIARNDEIYQRLSGVRDTMRQQRITLAPHDLPAFIGEVYAQMELGSQVILTQHLPEGPVYVNANPYQIREVLECLIRNALEAESPDPAKRRIRINLSLLRRYLSITISNNGPRIDPDLRDTIFDPFFSTKSPSKNWGLGLSLCKNIVILHRGRIWVDEQMDAGEMVTCFHIILPIMRT